jgi:hypothetical protein
MILQIAANARPISDHGDAVVHKMLRRTDAR